jgi:preprotein translocase subunit YajC
MSRVIIPILLLALAIGGMFFLASRVSEQPMTRHEKPVSLDALGK